LSAPVLIAGATVTAGILTLALRRLDDEHIPQAAVLAATFFVASLVNIPLGLGSVHLLLNGLAGLLLGWAAVPALLVGLTLQAVFFGYGGVLVLGVNTMNLALPALACALLFRRSVRCASSKRRFLGAAAAGATGVLLTGFMVSATVALSGEAFLPAARILFVAYLPLAVVEAGVTGATVAFLARVAPEVLNPLEVCKGE
jgi:cobalt/nickel transport system permease protein